MLYYILFNDQLSPEEAVIRFLITICVFFVSLALREFFRGVAATKMGDPTPKSMGRLTLNPIKHIDMSGFLFFMLLGVGWAKPMPINPLNFKKYKKGVRTVNLVGILTNFLLGLLCAFIQVILMLAKMPINQYTQYIIVILQYFMMVNSFLVLFNLLPLFPLDGFHIVASFMKTENKFIKFNLKNGVKVLFAILIADLIIDLLFGFGIIDLYLSLIYDFIYIPITWLGVL